MYKCTILSLFTGFTLLLLTATTTADEHSHSYEQGEEVVLWYSTVGPYANRQETYDIFQLPFCAGTKEMEHHHESLGEALLGVSLVNSGIDIHFNVPINGSICTSKLTGKDVNLFRYAVVNSYYFQFYIGKFQQFHDLPMWGYVGEEDPDTHDLLLYTHRDIEIGFNGNRIIDLNLTNSNPVKLRWDMQDLEVPFTYAVTWRETDQTFETRFNRYLDSSFFEHKFHWFSISNSFMMVIFLTGLVSVILLRTLRRDYARYDKEEMGLPTLDRDIGDEYGWKLIHGDVFRRPTHLTVLFGMVGTGAQLLTMVFLVILYTIAGDLYAERATMLTATIFTYALTSMISGYLAGSQFAQYGGKNWIGTMFFTSTLWPASVASVVTAVNFIAWGKNTSRAIPFTTMLAIVAIWLFMIFPLTLLGAIIGRNWSGHAEFPCRVNPIPRPIPDKHWWSEPLTLIALGGLLPFGSIFIEIYFIFSSFWAYKIYYVYGFMLLVFVILIIVTACVSIVSTYFLLNSEDHQWHWVSFLASGSTSVYVFLYSVYYFSAKTKMYGLFQTIWYFGYTGLVCWGLFIMLGTVGYVAADLFIRRIYRNVKID